MTEQPHVLSVTADNFQTEVVDRSQSVPVLLNVWAEWSEPCQQLQPLLVRLASSYQGKFILAQLNAEDNDPQVAQMAQGLMMQMGLRDLPALVFLHQGQPVQVLSGSQSEEDLTRLLNELTMSPVERITQEVEALKAEGAFDQALTLLQQVLKEEPDNHGLQVVQANLLLELGRIEEGQQVLAALPDDAPGINQPKAKLRFYQLAQELPSLVELEQLLHESPDSLELAYQRAIRYVLADRVEEALDGLLIIMREDRAFREDGARLLMLQLFDYLGKGSALAKRYRGRLFSLLH